MNIKAAAGLLAAWQLINAASLYLFPLSPPIICVPRRCYERERELPADTFPALANLFMRARRFWPDKPMKYARDRQVL
jgi:hypothetical protein